MALSIPSRQQPNPAAGRHGADGPGLLWPLPRPGRHAHRRLLFHAALATQRGDIVSPFLVYRANENRVEPLQIRGFTDIVEGHSAWWHTGRHIRLLAQTWHEQEQRPGLSVVDPFVGELANRWEIDGRVDCLLPLPGDQRYFASANRGHLRRSDEERGRLITLVENPMAVHCRSLATHSEGTPSLWVTDTQTDRHWRTGPASIQLVSLCDGTAWITAGPNLAAYEYDAQRCWPHGWQAQRGRVFVYRPGQDQIETIGSLESSGPLAEAPGEAGHVMVTVESQISVNDPRRSEIVQQLPLPNEVHAAATTPCRSQPTSPCRGWCSAVVAGRAENGSSPRLRRTSGRLIVTSSSCLRASVSWGSPRAECCRRTIRIRTVSVGFRPSRHC